MIYLFGLVSLCTESSVIDGLTYLLSALLITMMGGKWDVSPDEHYNSLWDAIKSMLSDGFKYLRTSYFGALVLIKASDTLTWGAVNVLNVSFSERGDIEGRSTRLGMIFAAVGVGCLVGPLIFDHKCDSIMNVPFLTNAFNQKLNI
jgi:hypothetical protein